MDFGKIPFGMDPVEARKKINGFLKEVKEDSKPEKCIICGKPQSSFCNSHSVPRMVLKNIARNGKVLQANSVLGVDVLDVEKGINNSGTFHFICNECDSKVFQHYENPEAFTAGVSDKLISEIALKDILLMLSKRNEEKILYKKLGETGRMHGVDTMSTIHELDIRDYMDEMSLYLEIDDTDKGNFKIVYNKILPFVTPIATQTVVALSTDLDGNEVNDLFDLSEKIRIQNLHIAIFPLKETTQILVFYHRRDKNYRYFQHQFNCLSEDKKLELINYYVFKYTENYYFSPLIKEILDNNEKLKLLGQENYELPNLGYISDISSFDYKPVESFEIPNFLTEQYALINER